VIVLRSQSHVAVAYDGNGRVAAVGPVEPSDLPQLRARLAAAGWEPSGRAVEYFSPEQFFEKEGRQ
jgi:hypothetical protein